MWEKLKGWVLGREKSPQDPQVFHNLSLVTFFAWVGLGADGLSSSAYGPDEAYRALGAHTHLAIILVAMTTITIFVISIAYSNLIEHFPGGGGGYIVATQLLGPRMGVVSGSALLVDYVLTISVSIASGCDALWSFLPAEWAPYKLTGAAVLLVVLLILNLRGVKESVSVLAPIFLLFIVTHVFMILYAIGSRFWGLPRIFQEATLDFNTSVATVGFFPVAFIIMHAYSMGGGTYTGIEAVSNSVSMLREPRVKTGKRTMLLMAVSLAFTAGGILFGYLLTNSQPVAGKTMNAVLLDNLFGGWIWGGLSVGTGFVVVALISEAALLLVAAQAGFLAGPRVLANMAADSWMPRRFSQLSDRLVSQNGVLLMGVAALATLIYTKGNITTLVIMYSINVFITFTLTELGMSKHWIVDRLKVPNWKRLLFIHGTGLVMCLSILLIILHEKFAQGGWVTLGATGLLIASCFLIKRHYGRTTQALRRLNEIMVNIPVREGVTPPEKNHQHPTAILMVSGYDGIGIHSFLAIHRFFPGHFRNFVFVSVGAVDSSRFKGAEELKNLKATVEADLKKYVKLANGMGLYAEYDMAVDNDVIEGLETLCQSVGDAWPKKVYFMGQLAFEADSFWNRVLHNQTAFTLQRRLIFKGFEVVVLPIRVRLQPTQLPG
jgi:amino acid transporter